MVYSQRLGSCVICPLSSHAFYAQCQKRPRSSSHLRYSSKGCLTEIMFPATICAIHSPYPEVCLYTPVVFNVFIMLQSTLSAQNKALPKEYSNPQTGAVFPLISIDCSWFFPIFWHISESNHSNIRDVVQGPMPQYFVPLIIYLPINQENGQSKDISDHYNVEKGSDNGVVFPEYIPPLQRTAQGIF